MYSVYARLFLHTNPLTHKRFLVSQTPHILPARLRKKVLMMDATPPIEKLVMFDLDGTIYIGDKVLPGA